jgi:DNA-binding transcriptional LysR family regulator
MQVIDMELRDIEYFSAVAEHGNVRRAAEALGMSQPAISKSLRRLEQSLDAKLVARTPKGVELTPVGSALLAQVRRIRLTLDDVAREAGDLSQGRAGHLRIGAGPTVCEDLPPVYAILLKSAPKLTVEITVSDNDVMVPALHNGELDLIFNFLPVPPYEGTIQEHLYDDQFVVVASANHRLSKLKRVTIADVAQERWALSNPFVRSQQGLYQAFQQRGLQPPRIAVETRLQRLRLQTWASTDLLGYVSRRVLLQAARGFRLKELPIKELAWRCPFGVIYREGGYLSPAARRFIEILKATAKEIAAEKR